MRTASPLLLILAACSSTNPSPPAVDAGSGCPTVATVRTTGFEPAVAFPAEGQPMLVAIADVDGDCRGDLVVVTSAGTDSALLLVSLADGARSFGATAVVHLPGISFPRALLVADLDGDGHVDVAVDGEVTDVLLDHGDGTFGSATSYAVGGSLAAADVDGDGHVDLLAGDIVLRGAGDGTFTVPAGVAQTSFVTAVADFDGDGAIDFVALDGVGSASLHLGRGDGTFGAGAAIALGSNVGTGVIEAFEAADVDGDGRPDVLLADCCSAVVVHNAGSGALVTGAPVARTALTDALTSGAIGDVDGDGTPDIVVPDPGPAGLIGGAIETFSVVANGSVRAPSVVLVGSQPVGIAVGDLDGDGRGDVVITDFAGMLWLLYGT